MSIFGPPNVQNMKSHRDVKGLVRALDYRGKDRDAIKQSAVRALGELKDPSAAAPLIACMRVTAWEDQKAIVDALVMIGPPVVDALIKALSDENGTIRSRAALALRQLHDERAVMPLIEALRVEKDEKIRSWIINSFGVLGDTRAVEPLIEALNDPGENNRNLAIECLGILRDRKAFEPLTGVINQKTSNEKTRGLAMKALVQLGDPTTVDFLAGLIKKKTTKKDLRILAIEALGELRDARAVDLLGGILNDRTANVEFRNAAVNALVKIGSPTSEALITFAVKNKDENRLVDLLIDLLIQNLLRSGGPWHRDELIEIFCRIGAPAGELLVETFEYNRHETTEMQILANALIQLYQRKALSAGAKKKLLAFREMIVSEHTDTIDYDVPSCQGGQSHIDKGIGLDFPL